MATPKTTVWSLDPHTSAKHAILRRYLQAWFPILASHNGRMIYLDGFCGPGRYQNGEPGSPVIALQEAEKHLSRMSRSEIVFIFVDEDPKRIEHLRQELVRYEAIPNFKIYITTGQFESELRQILDFLDSQQLTLAPTFAFIDPFGFKGLPFELVARLLRNPKTEVLVNVMVDSINRFLESPDLRIRNYLVSLYGTNNVLTVPLSARSRVQELQALYQRQLAAAARFVRFFEMRDCNDRVIYNLFFASQHPLGHARIKEAFWKVDPDGGYSFSDATDPSQLVLFNSDPAPFLAEELLKTFTGQKVSDAQVKEYVRDSTPFIDKHTTAALRKLEDENKIRISPKWAEQKRRRHTFKDVNITFQ